MITDKNIQNIINAGSGEGFTTPIRGELKRYVVAFTHNETLDVYKIARQARQASIFYKQVNIGGWIDSDTNVKYVDVSTSFNNLQEAIEFAKVNKQIALWDGVAMKEIRI